MLKLIIHELKHHALFTFLGAILGVGIMIILRNMPAEESYNVFYVLHPLHVLLSAIVTASVYRLHAKGGFLSMLLIGYFGSVGIATLSDSLIPYLGESLLGLPNRGAHIGFIEKWWLVNPMALLGITFAYFKPTTKIPHSGHVFLSTAASVFHILAALNGTLNVFYCIVILFFLFIAVWMPCCISDIVFPLLFVKKKHKI